jgi:NAD(P)-dependent dehydrogenase (short-subunit alcohol dehydrogenase family)
MGPQFRPAAHVRRKGGAHPQGALILLPMWAGHLDQKARGTTKETIVADDNGVFHFAGRRFVVTGAARGIGYAIARLVAASGGSVAVLDLEGAKPEASAAKLRDEVQNAEIVSGICDVSSYEQVVAARDAVESHWGAPADTLVNNAGIAYNAPAEEMTVAEWERMLSINLSGVFYCSQVFGTRMIEQHSGSIVSIASMSGIIVNRPQPQVAYNVSKAGVIMLTKSLAAEWAPHGVRVNAVAPGYIHTSLVEKFIGTDILRDYWTGGTPLGRMGTPEEIANAVAFLASSQASFVTGATLVADGGYTLW